MKFVLKFISFTFLTIILLIIALVVTAYLAEDKITKRAVEELGKAIKAPIGMEDVSFSLVSEFPLASVRFKKLWIAAPYDDTTGVQELDTIAIIDNLFISMLSKPLLDSIFDIKAVEIHGARLKYLVDTIGVSNIDFLLGSGKDTVQISEKDSTALNLPEINLERLTLENIWARYEDAQHGVKAQVEIPALEIEGNAFGSQYTGDLAGSLVLSQCAFKGTNLHKMNKATLQIEGGYARDTVSVNKFILESEGLKLALDGRLALTEHFFTSSKVDISEFNISELKKYVPDSLFEQYKISKLSGDLLASAVIKGDLSGEKMPAISACFDLKKTNLRMEGYPEITRLRLKGKADNGSQRNELTTRIHLDTAIVRTPHTSLDLKAIVANLKHPKYDLVTKLDVQLEEWKDFIPDSVIQKLSGRAKVALSTSGTVPKVIDSTFTDYLLKTVKTQITLTDVNLKLDDKNTYENLSGTIQYAENRLILNDITGDWPAQQVGLRNSDIELIVKGSLTRMDTLSVTIPKFKLYANGVDMEGNLTAHNLNKPSYTLNTAINVDLDKVKSLVPDTLVKDMTGRIALKIQSSGKVDPETIKKDWDELVFKKGTYQLSIHDLTLDMPDTLMNVKNLSGDVDLKPDAIKLSKLHGQYMGIDFEFDSTNVSNYYSTLIQNQPGDLVVKGITRFGAINYNSFLPFFVKNPESESEDHVQTDTAKPEGWGGTVNAKGKLFIKNFTYNKVFLDNISTLFSYTDSTQIIDQLKFKAFDGEMVTSAKLEMKSDGRVIIDSKHQITDMDIQKLLMDFDNFGMEDFTYKNISGVFTTQELDTRTEMIGFGDSILYDKLRLKGDITLKEGGIYNYAQVSEGLKSLPKVENPDTLLFRTLNTKLFVFNNYVYVPSTIVESSAFDLGVYGSQGLEGDYLYYIDIRLREVLQNNQKKMSKDEKDDTQKFNLEDVRDEPNARHYKIKGDEKDFKLDLTTSRDEREQMRIKIKTQDRILKATFYPERINYKTDVSFAE